ncbi:quinoprotein relay system zinc metallohydrolase 1 [Marinobacterium sedimentorum]|uniref:quinoprotein relay system zinc metallohydrolase 1 n=1 Tax=Marinobacterium sedimentorum TaxID=2927804 RepID=UPI0020C71943|nr:quinoprotein relay system zinc metallohydrolase 1 [Marinobacterium sedimentorum]MCP8689878.1 quinoprotein relay system zinc metallohydrolase 1 [Marinobacterium sedimentorum]
MRTFVSLILLALLIAASPSQGAERFDYDLKPRQIAPDTWLVEGRRESFSTLNGGNIVNVAFIVTDAGVVLFDTGPSRRFGEQLRRAIASVTDKPVVRVFNSHAHPDHFLGNQAFADATVSALAGTVEQIRQNGDSFATNLYALTGDWMRGTDVVVPGDIQDAEQQTLGGHRLRFLAFEGHTGADLVMLDETTGVLFAGDLVFYQRALTTPQTPGLGHWRDELDQLARLDYRLLVPGHGPLDSDRAAIGQMQDYLVWLDATLARAAALGLTMTEVMVLPIDPRFDAISLTRYEFGRSVAHLYPGYEEAAF